jgi:hypothetical protein
MSEGHCPAVPLERVLQAELVEIQLVRKQREITNTGKKRCAAVPPQAPVAGSAEVADPPWEDPYGWVEAVGKAHAANLVGVAFSGGGIRSATFNLGVLQALAELKLLHRVDYLSTVSGGGYIGGWLAAWTKRLQSFGGFGEVQKRLATNRVHQKDDKEPSPIRFLRMFSNYLTPKIGISGDTLAMVGIYLRNMLLNQVVVLAVLTALLLVPRLAEKCALAAEDFPGVGSYWLGIGFVLLVVAFLIIVTNMVYLDCGDDGRVRRRTKQSWILGLAAGPLFFVAVLGALWQVVRFYQTESGSHDNHLPYGGAAAIGALAYFTIWAVASAVEFAWRRCLAPIVSKASGNKRTQATMRPAPENAKSAATNSIDSRPAQHNFVATLLGAACAGTLAGWLYALLSELTLCWTVKAALTAGAPLVLGIFLLAGTLHIGLMGTKFHDSAREWWGRLGGWLLLWGGVWMAVFWIALYFPDFIKNDKLVRDAAAKYLTPAWILTTLASVVAGKSKTSGEPGKWTWKDWIAKVGPFAFIVGLLGWISYGIERVQELNLFCEYRNQSDPRVWAGINTSRPWLNASLAWASGWLGSLFANMSRHRLCWALVLCVVVAAVMAWRVDVNQFSLHLFYRNRLVRCYLGASNEDRSPNRFTGFDRHDDMPLKDLRVQKGYDGPYPIMNASLNLVKGKDLAWQERKAESFVMTPQFCGYDVWLEEQDSPMLMKERTDSTATQMGANAAPTTDIARDRDTNACAKSEEKLHGLDQYGYRPTALYAFPPPLDGPWLGLAMGISGAAVSPNMGFYSSAPVAFLMTLFDVRLGQWLGNPRNPKTWRSATPTFGLTYLLNELFAGTDDDSAYVYLSDGGHFENMGLYELVKRRCGLIIVCDAEEDDCYGFKGLGNAIRECRIDLGIDIQLDVSDITPQKAGEPSKKHCAIGTVHYETVDKSAPTGTIIYFKASLTGDESTDLKNYQTMHPKFPHDSTANQWFTESQFESYRELGYHEVMTSMNSQATAGTPSQAATWTPADAAAAKSASLAKSKIQAAGKAAIEAETAKSAKLDEAATEAAIAAEAAIQAAEEAVIQVAKANAIQSAERKAIQAAEMTQAVGEAPWPDTADSEQTLKDKEASKSGPLNKQLKDALDRFGFDTSRLA